MNEIAARVMLVDLANATEIVLTRVLVDEAIEIAASVDVIVVASQDFSTLMSKLLILFLHEVGMDLNASVGGVRIENPDQRGSLDVIHRGHVHITDDDRAILERRRVRLN